MDMDKVDVVNHIDGKTDGEETFPKKRKVKIRSEESDESDSNDSDSDNEANDIEDDAGQILAILSDDDMEEDNAADVKDEWEGYEQMVKYDVRLTRGRLMEKANQECLILDPGAGFYLIDGDSLMLEALGTKSWRHGQQLHFFYVVEIFLFQLRQNGGGIFEIVFFSDMEKIWYKDADVTFRVFREALINHLKVNCGINVHSSWKDPFCEEWLKFLDRKNPSFIFIHDGFDKYPSVNTALKILAYKCLAHNLDVSFTTDVKQRSSKLYAVIVEASHSHSLPANKAYLQEAWTCLIDFFNSKFLEVSGISEYREITNFKDGVFVESLSHYWNDLSEEEKGTSDEIHFLNRWCYYFAVLSCSTLSERIAIARETDVNSKSTSGRLWYKFVLCVLRSLPTVCKSLQNCSDPESITDIIDFAVYYQLFVCDEVTAIISSNVVGKKFSALHELAKSRGLNFETKQIVNFRSTPVQTDTLAVEEDPKLVAIESNLAEEYSGGVKKTLKVSETGDLDVEDEVDDFEDIYSWMWGETIKDDIDHETGKSLSKAPFVRKKQLRDIQTYNDFIAMYGKSLENSIEPTLITKSENKENKKTEKVPQKQKSKKQTTKKNMKETIIEENKKKIMEENKKKVATQWRSKKSEIEEMQDDASAIKKVVDFIRKSESNKLGYEEPVTFLMQMQYDRWKQSCADDVKNLSYAADIVQTLHGILQSLFPVSDNLKVKIAKYFLRIGFKEVASQLTQTLPEAKHSSVKVTEKCPVDISYNVFQMGYMGHLLQRQERYDPDPRVSGFIPDTWQRELLDVVDKNESAVIVAPTSSGKTFCSFYCMEKVLRENDTNVVVYVSPTKALVNQVQASIYARYKKNMPAGMSVVGVFTRDYQHNALTSQILVTVPQCLEILLLSPKRQQWASRISYVIFDEVHCIGGEHGGEVWEHLITSIRCPFLALSATIGNPDYFHGWLRCVNKFKEMQGERNDKNKPTMKYSVKLVIHNERYSDINKNIYIPRSDEIIATHPCLFLDAHFLSANGFPSAFSLSPKESYELWLAGKFTFDDDIDNANILKKWDPERYFGDCLYITKQKAREYEIDLKEQLKVMLSGNLEKAQIFISYFRDKLPSHLITQNDNQLCHLPGISELEFDIYKMFPQLIERLKKEDKLPVIVFMNNRHGIEKLARSLTDHVTKKIDEVRDKMSQVHTRQSEADKYAKKTVKSRKNRDSDGEEVEDHMQEYLQNMMGKLTLQIQEKENACKFITPCSMSTEDREKVMAKVKDRLMLEYGIGFHHAGCNIKHKRAVEILFRSQHAQVALATATLALGIHMPCKSVVFVGDDHYVDALNYRQMSGRSGRRGFDNLGNVIFYGVPLPKISKLIKADISKLEGQFPVNCTIVLRLLFLVANASDSDDAHRKALTVLSHPFITHQAPSLQDQLKHYFLFVTDFLIRQALVDEKGIPLGFAGLVSHLHHHEPGNVVFVNLLRKGVFHAFCKPSKVSQPINFGYTCKTCNASPILGNRMACTKCPFDYSLCVTCFNRHVSHRFRKEEHKRPDFHENGANLKYTFSEDTLRRLVCILSHIFYVKEVPQIRLKRNAANTLVLKRKPKFASKVILDRMTADVRQAVSAYNRSVQSIFGNYLSVVSKSMDRLERAILPISNKSWELSDSNHGASAVHPFVQLSGVSNRDVKSHCLDTEEIKRILPREIYMDFNFIPALPISNTKNAFALDFFKHCSKKAILMDNWIPLGEIYDSLNDFRLLIGTISTALDQLCPDNYDDHVIWAFKHLNFEFTHRFSLVYPVRKKI